MRELIHIGNFKRKSNKVLTGYNAKMFVNGKEVGHFNGIDYSIDRENIKDLPVADVEFDAFRGIVEFEEIHILGKIDPEEIVPVNIQIECECSGFDTDKNALAELCSGGVSIEDDITIIADQTLARDIDKRKDHLHLKTLSQALSGDIEASFFGEYGLAGVVKEEDQQLTLETLKETAKMCAENYRQAEEVYLPFGIAHRPLKIDMDSIKTEIIGNEMHVSMNAIFTNSINFIPLNISIDNLSIAPVKELVHIGNFEDIT